MPKAILIDPFLNAISVAISNALGFVPSATNFVQSPMT